MKLRLAAEKLCSMPIVPTDPLRVLSIQEGKVRVQACVENAWHDVGLFDVENWPVSGYRFAFGIPNPCEIYVIATADHGCEDLV